MRKVHALTNQPSARFPKAPKYIDRHPGPPIQQPEAGQSSQNASVSNGNRASTKRPQGSRIPSSSRATIPLSSLL
ncbi:hypothetical protein RRG08_046185 [Elysia crispata]|uniref:Uncharacterized protein n=1 Tax=Elysia crispata TaxID=231223 RepID=A0AAE0XNH7_9GAST|nr:hypothetical protein RRG08_046185 [Elysia crispata]